MLLFVYWPYSLKFKAYDLKLKAQDLNSKLETIKLIVFLGLITIAFTIKSNDKIHSRISYKPSNF